MQGLGKNGIQVALQRAFQLCIGHHFAGRPADDVGDFGGECGAAARGQLVGALPCQNFVADDTQAIHIAGGSNGFAANLFGTGVVRRKGTGPLGLGVPQLLTQQSRDAEVQQMRPTVAADQDVGRLDVAMNDQTGVGVLNGFENLQQEPEPVADRRVVRFAELRNRYTVDEFESEIGFAAIRDARVVKSRDVGVFETGENVSLLDRPLGKCPYPTDMRSLEGDGALDDSIDPFSEPDTAHAAFADVPQEPVRTDLGAGLFRG